MNRTFIFLAFLLLSAIYIEGKPEAINELFEELVELNAQVKTSQFAVKNLVNQVRSESAEASRNSVTYENNVKLTCSTGQSDLQSFLTKLNGDMVAAKAGMESTNRQIAEDKAKSKKVYEENENNKRGHQQEVERQRDVQRTFRRHVAEAHRKLAVIQHVTNIIHDELLNANATGKRASLIQVTTVTEKLQELKTLVAKDEDTMFSHIVETLIEMATEQNLNDQDVLRNILAALNKLQSSMLSWMKNAKADNKKIRMINREENAARLKTIRNSEKLLADYAASDTLNRRTVEDLNIVYMTAGTAFHHKRREFNSYRVLCEDQYKLFAKLQMERKTFNSVVEGVFGKFN